MLLLRRLFPSEQARVLLFSLAEGPTSNVKDLVAISMIDSARNLGLLKGKTKIIEATSGSSGIALASATAKLALDLTIVAPENILPSISAVIEKFGAHLELTPIKQGMNGAVETVRKMTESDHRFWSPNLFENPANPAIHEATTAVQIWKETQGVIDAFVCAAGSGATFTGVARFLIKRRPEVLRIIVEPKESSVLSGKTPGKHGIQGIGAGFIPQNLNVSLASKIETVSTEEAIHWSKRLAQTEGVLAGTSTGANLAAIAKLLKLPEFQYKTIVTVAFDKQSF